MRFNLSATRHYMHKDNKRIVLEDVYFAGLQNKCLNAHLNMSGSVDVLGICFTPDGLYPFLQIPISEFKNRILGADEIGFDIAKNISERLRDTQGIANRLSVLEGALLSVLDHAYQIPDDFRLLFTALNQNKSLGLTEFCRRNNISLRQLERLFLKYVGLSANTYNTLDRFHGSLNQLLSAGYSKLSDLAYDNDYFDQTHFVKEFKRFSGNTPGNFINRNDSILQIAQLT